MRQKIVVAIGVMLLVAVSAGSAFGWNSRDGQDRDAAQHKEKAEALARELHLSADQEKQLAATREAYRLQLEKLRSTIKEKRRALQEELSKPGVTRQGVEPIVAELKALHATMIEQRLDGIFKLKEILTPDQFAKLQAKKANAGKSGRRWRGGKEW